MVFVLAWVEGIGKWLRWMRFVKSFTRIRMSGKMYYLESTTVSWRENISNLSWDSHDAREGEREREREKERDKKPSGRRLGCFPGVETPPKKYETRIVSNGISVM